MPPTNTLPSSTVTTQPSTSASSNGHSEVASSFLCFLFLKGVGIVNITTATLWEKFKKFGKDRESYYKTHISCNDKIILAKQVL